jgi:hypothetical protein
MKTLEVEKTFVEEQIVKLVNEFAITAEERISVELAVRKAISSRDTYWKEREMEAYKKGWGDYGQALEDKGMGQL